MPRLAGLAPDLAPLLAPILALAALVLSSCSPDDRALIRVGSQKVTVRDFQRAARTAQSQYEGPPEVAKATLLQDLERRALMLELAHRLGQESSQVLANTQRDNEQRVLVQALYARVASPAQRVSEAEARSLYEARRVEADVWLLYSSSFESAKAAMARLEHGEPFANVAKTYNMPGLLPSDGGMGFIAPGALPEPLDSALRAQAAGAIGGPYRTREGWFVMKIARRRPREQGPFESLRAGMVDLMRQRKQRAAFNRAYLQMKTEYEVEPAPGGAQLLFRVGSAVDPITPTPDQRRMPLATYRGGVYTLQDALLDLQRADASRPAFQLLPAIEIWIEAQVMTRVAVLEARKRHLDEEPEILAGLRAQREQALLDGVYQAAVANVPAPGPDQVKLAWERVKSQFTKLDTSVVAILDVADSAKAEAVSRERATTPSLEAAAKRVDASLAVKQAIVLYPRDEATWGTFQAMFTAQPAGSWFGPEKRPSGWRLMQLVRKTTLQQTFEELPAGLQKNIEGSAGELARDARFNQFTDSLASAFHPIVDRELAAKLAWPPPEPLDVGR